MTICTDTRRREEKTDEERFERMTTEVRETRGRFWTNIPSWRREGRRRGGTRRRGAFVEWMVP